MNEHSDSLYINEYNTVIKDIAGVGELSTFYRIISECFSTEGENEAIILKHLSSIRTERTRKKVAWAVNKSVLHFYNEDHQSLISNIFSGKISVVDKSFVFFWHLSLTNRLFREISVDLFIKIYLSGRVSISQDDIIPYLKEIKDKNEKPLWADETIYRIATKYLSLMTKLEFVSEGRIKSFKYIRPSIEAQVLFLYLANLYNPVSNNLLINPLLNLSFIEKADLLERLKKISMRDYFHLNYNGVALNIELIHSYKGICDVLYH